MYIYPTEVTIVSCAVCGGGHENVPMRKMTSPPVDATQYKFFVMCPKADEPIVLSVEGLNQ